MVQCPVVIILMAGTGDPLAQHVVRVTLKGYDNDTYHGTLILRNLSAFFADHIGRVKPAETSNMTLPIPGSPGHPEDPSGASYYVVAVVLVYGMSIVMLIASHIKRKHTKLIEDKQIHKYLREFQIVKEKSSRDSYRSLKKSIMAKLNMHRNPTYKTLSHAILPMIAVGLPAGVNRDGSSSETDSVHSTSRRASLQANTLRPGYSALGKGRARRASEFDINWKQINDLSGRMFSRASSEESNDSRRGRRSRTNSQTLPSTIEEGQSPPLNKEMSTVIEMSDDEFSKATTDVPVENTETSAPLKPDREPNERCYYKPISISRACRVYEIPRNAQNEMMKPGGVHVAVHRPVATSPTRPTPTRAIGVDITQPRNMPGHAPGLSDESMPNRPQYNVPSFNVSRRTDNSLAEVTTAEQNGVIGGRTNTSGGQSPDERVKHQLPIPNMAKDTSVQIPVSSTTVPALIHTSPETYRVPSPGEPHSIKPKLVDRRATRRINGDQPNPVVTTDSHSRGDNIWIKPFQDLPVQDQRLPSQHECNSDSKPLYIDVRASIHQPQNKASPPPDRYKSCPVGGRPSHTRRSSWSPSGHSGQQRARKRDLPRKPLSSLSSYDSPTPKGTPEARDRSASVSYESVSLYSETSSESDDVWLAMRQRAALQLETPGDSDDINYRPRFMDIDYHGLGSTPLLTPKEMHKPDFDRDSRQTSRRPQSSRSVSPTYSQGSDTEKLIHQVTSV